MKLKFVVLILLSLIFTSCEKCSREQIQKQTPKTSDKEISIGTFNIEWLGDGYNDRIERSEEDYKNIARIIDESKCDIVGVQEIENVRALEKLIKYLPDFSFYLSRDNAPQKVGFLFRKNIKVKYLGDYSPLEVELDRTRPGIFLAVQKGDFDFIVLVVHFKATSRFDDTKEKMELSRNLRMLQAQVVSRFADSILAQNNEQDVLIIGDFNDTPKRTKFNTLVPIISNPNLSFLTSDLKSCKLQNAYTIDHIVVTQSVKQRYIENSTSLYNTYAIYPKEIAEKISDHCLVFARFDVTKPDNDPSKYFEHEKNITSK